ncbi:MAG: hypothetical protein WED01_01610 [Candidatus Rokuibacteriota bacterium]
MSMEMFDPTARPAARTTVLARRPATLTGLRIGLVDNTKFNSEPILQRMAQHLGRRHGMTVAHLDRKRSASHEVAETAIEAFKRRVDFVVSGIGD